MASQISQPKAPADGVDFLHQAFSDAVSASMSTLLGRDVDVSPDASGSFEGASLWFHAEFAPVPNGALLFGGSRESWLALGKQFLAAAGIDDADPELVLSTLNEASAQVIGSIASAMTGRLGHELSAKTSPAATEVPAFAKTWGSTLYCIQSEDVSDTHVSLLISPQLDELFAPRELVRTGDLTPHAKNLELLMDVEMPVSISFGRAQLPLKDVIKLTTGSIVELNRSVSEPVDIIVNNCTVARGEVVVVEGNFGVRIKEVLSKEDRLKRLA